MYGYHIKRKSPAWGGGHKGKNIMKTNYFKHLLATVVTMLVALPLWSADGDTFTAETVEGVSMTFKVISESAKTCEVINDSYPIQGVITIPSSAKGYSVTSIGMYAFNGCSGLTSVTIPSSVTSIGRYAFLDCTSLTSVSIPSSVTSIGRAAFACCSGLTSITIPEGLTSIEESVFEECSGLTSINIPEGVTSIGESAFEDCSGLTSINIPEGVTTIGRYAFQDCTSLTSVTIPSSVTSIGRAAFAGSSGLISVNVATENSVYDSREECNAIIETASNILVAGCPNTVIPSSVTSIGESAFEDCSGLTSINIPESVTSIGEYAFSHCTGLASVTIPSSVTGIGYCAFAGCVSLTSIIVATENSVYDSREECNAIIETASNTLVAGCPNTVIPSSVTSIGYCAFSGCSGLTSITIPEGVTSIGNYAFSSCSGITSITIPSSVTSIGDGAIMWCTHLTDVYCFAENIPSTGYGVFEQVVTTDVTLHVPASALEAYKNTAPWSSFGTIVSIEGELAETKICVNGIYYNLDASSKQAEVTSNDNTKYSGDITIPATVTYYSMTYDVTSIGMFAFNGCSGLTSITIPSSVTSIGSDAFYGCSGLTSITISEGVMTIGSDVFHGCSSLTSITIPSSVWAIGRRTFCYCTGLKDVYCLAEDIPSKKDDLFSMVNIASVTLHVPASALDAYKTTEPWSSFGSIVAIETAIADIATDEGKTFVYDLSGRRVEKAGKGIYIVNGKKVFKD